MAKFLEDKVGNKSSKRLWNRKMAKFLEGTKGKKSSKRLWGSILLGYGSILSLVVFSVALKNHDYKTCNEIVWTIIGVGAGLIGVNFIPDTWGKSER